MTSTIRHIPRVISSSRAHEPIHGGRHPMRAVTRATAFDDASWTPERAREVTTYFDDQARDWEARFAADDSRLAPLEDALERGTPITFGRCADVGCGTGITTARLESRFEAVVGLDISRPMLDEAPRGVSRVLADSAALPIATASQDAVVLMNAFLFAREVDRVLAPGGVVVWISAVGADTPIYLSADDLGAALPGDWSGVWSEAANGTWAVLRRA
jgi:SAM-dependent methyltransferase